MSDGIVPQNLYLFGSGTFAVDLCNLLDSAGIHVEGVLELEGQRIGHYFLHGRYVVKSASKTLPDLPLPVLLATHNPQADIRRIATTLEELGAPLVLTPLQMYQDLRMKAIEAPAHYWLAGTRDIDPIIVDPEPLALRALRSRLRDAHSVECLDALIGWRRTGSWRDAPHPRPMYEQYCSADVPLPRHQISFVDVGAFTGDTIQNMAEQGFSFERITALEPDPVNFPGLLRTLRAIDVPAVALTIGAGPDTGVLRFNASGTASSALDGEGDSRVQIQRLDDLLIGQRVDYVKMDIEGGELGAIQGLVEVISSQAPTLAISAYHKPADLIDIPELLTAMRPDYNYYLRTYAHSSFDTVLYAVSSG